MRQADRRQESGKSLRSLVRVKRLAQMRLAAPRHRQRASRSYPLSLRRLDRAGREGRLRGLRQSATRREDQSFDPQSNSQSVAPPPGTFSHDANRNRTRSESHSFPRREYPSVIVWRQQDVSSRLASPCESHLVPPPAGIENARVHPAQSRISVWSSRYQSAMSPPPAPVQKSNPTKDFCNDSVSVWQETGVLPRERTRT